MMQRGLRGRGRLAPAVGCAFILVLGGCHAGRRQARPVDLHATGEKGTISDAMIDVDRATDQPPLDPRGPDRVLPPLPPTPDATAAVTPDAAAPGFDPSADAPTGNGGPATVKNPSSPNAPADPVDRALDSALGSAPTHSDRKPPERTPR